MALQASITFASAGCIRWLYAYGAFFEAACCLTTNELSAASSCDASISAKILHSAVEHFSLMIVSSVFFISSSSGCTLNVWAKSTMSSYAVVRSFVILSITSGLLVMIVTIAALTMALKEASAFSLSPHVLPFSVTPPAPSSTDGPPALISLASRAATIAFFSW
eukprot:9503935-Pyramimonas_sp.AAC.4